MTLKAEHNEFGTVVHILREDRGLSLRELATQSGLDYSYVCMIEKGRRRPSESSKLSLCSALNISAKDVAVAGSLVKLVRRVLEGEPYGNDIVRLEAEVDDVLAQLRDIQHNWLSKVAQR